MSLKPFLLAIGLEQKRDEAFVDTVIKIFKADLYEITEAEQLIGVDAKQLAACQSLSSGKLGLMVTLCLNVIG